MHSAPKNIDNAEEDISLTPISSILSLFSLIIFISPLVFKELNTFLNEIVSLKANDKASDLKLDISNLAWEISEELQNQSYDELRLESLIWIVILETLCLA